MKGLNSYATKTKHDDSEMLELSRKIETGFPSPAGDHLEKSLSLEELIVHRPTSTFYVRAEGSAMQAAGIYDGDILVVDRSLHPRDGSIIIVSLNEEVIIRRLAKKGNRIFLVSGDIRYAPIPVNEGTEWTVWGVATHLIHRFKNQKEETEQEEKVYEM
ncbi:MAG: LexA family protein [Balneola sp.]